MGIDWINIDSAFPEDREDVLTCDHWKVSGWYATVAYHFVDKDGDHCFINDEGQAVSVQYWARLTYPDKED